MFLCVCHSLRPPGFGHTSSSYPSSSSYLTMVDYSSTVPNPFTLSPQRTDLVSGETILDAIASLKTSHHTLTQAGAPEEQLGALRVSIAGLNKKMEQILAERRTAEKASSQSFGPIKDDGQAPDGQAPGVSKNLTPSSVPAGRKLYSGVVGKLQRGQGGFSALWKRRWVSVERGWLKCFSTDCRPSPATNSEPEEAPEVFIPLTDKGTVIEEDLTPAFKKRFGAKMCFSVTSKDVFGTRRSLTFECNTDKDKLAWISAVKAGIVATKFAPTSSLWRAAQNGDLEVLKLLVVDKQKNVNASNAYSMTALMYAVQTAARSAGDTSKGRTPAVPVLAAFQCVAFLMSKGANPTQANESNHDAFDLVKAKTAEYPRARRLMLTLLDSAAYEVEGGSVWIEPENEQKLRSYVEAELGGVMVGGLVEGPNGDGEGKKGGENGGGGRATLTRETLTNVDIDGKGGTRKVRMLYSQKRTVGSPAGKGSSNGSKGSSNGRTHNKQFAGRTMADGAADGATRGSLWPEHHRQSTQQMPYRAVGDGELQKDYENPLVSFFKSQVGASENKEHEEAATARRKDKNPLVSYFNSQGGDENKEHKAAAVARRKDLDAAKKADFVRMTSGEMREGRRPESAPMGGRSGSRKSADGGKYKPGYWTTDLPQ